MDYPLVTIGLPVYNGERYLEKTIKSVLAQNYPNVCLIILDNASTDQTSQISKKYAKTYSNVYYYKNSKNIGAMANHNRVFELSNSKYFKWIGDDDHISKDYISKCVKVLESDPSVVLCFTKWYRIDENDKITGRYQHPDLITSRKTHKRFFYSMGFLNDIFGIFGVFRSDAIRQTRLFGTYVCADRNLFAELSLTGRFYQLPQYLLSIRWHTESYSYNFAREGREELLVVRNCIEYLKSIFHIPLSTQDRIMCLFSYCIFIIFEGGPLMLCDLEEKFLGRSLFFVKLRSVMDIVSKRIFRKISSFHTF